MPPKNAFRLLALARLAPASPPTPPGPIEPELDAQRCADRLVLRPGRKEATMEVASRQRFVRLASAGTLLVAALAAPVIGQTTSRVNLDSAGAQANGTSYPGWISADGRHVAFRSYANNLVPGGSNNAYHVYAKDCQSGQIQRASASSCGTMGNSDSEWGDISGDGRYVAFWSWASNLVTGDTNQSADTFVHDCQSGATERVSVDSTGVQGNWSSYSGAISADGRYVAFDSEATNLVTGDTNAGGDVFLRDRQLGQTTRVSVDSSGNQGDLRSQSCSISADGRFVAFQRTSTNLVPGDTNGKWDVFVHDCQSGQTTRVSVDSAGVQGNGDSGVSNTRNPSISDDGRYVAFFSYSTNLVPGGSTGAQIFVRDLQSGQNVLASVNSAGAQGISYSFQPSISGDGRYVAFYSHADNLVPGDTNLSDDVFGHDLLSGQTERLSVDTSGVGGNSNSYWPSISADGRYVAFSSQASNLVPGDTNGQWDVFIRDRGGCSAPTTYCTAKVNSLGCTPAIAFTGTPSASAGSGFLITATNEMSHKNGLLFYGTTGRAALSFQGGYLCVSAPTRLTLLQHSGGTPPPSDCTGQFSYDFNARIASGVDASLVAGAMVDCQYWSRDPGFAVLDNTSLSAGLEFTICP